MALWTNEPNPFGQNRTPGMIGWASDGSGVIVPVAVDPASGAILTDTASTSTGNVNIVKIGSNAVTTFLPVQDAAAEASLATLASTVSGGNQNTTLTDVYLALKEMINVMIRPPWVDQGTGTLRTYLTGNSGSNQTIPFIALQGLWTSLSSQNSTTQANQFSPTDSLINPLNKQSWGVMVRERIN